MGKGNRKIVIIVKWDFIAFYCNCINLVKIKHVNSNDCCTLVQNVSDFVLAIIVIKIFM